MIIHVRISSTFIHMFFIHKVFIQNFSIFIHIHPEFVFLHLFSCIFFFKIFVHIHPENSYLHPYSPRFFYLHPYSPRFIRSSSIFIRIFSNFIRHDPFLSIFIGIRPDFWSSSIFIQKVSIFIHIHPFIQKFSFLIHIHPDFFDLYPYSSGFFRSLSLFTQKNSIFGDPYLEKNHRKTQDLSP